MASLVIPVFLKWTMRAFLVGEVYTIVVKMRHEMIRVSKCGKYDPVVRTKSKILHSSHEDTFQIKKCTLRLKTFWPYLL